MEKLSKPILKLVSASQQATGDTFSALVAETYRVARKDLVRFLTLQSESVAEAEDIAQNAYLKLLSKASTLTDGNLRSLLFITARNLALDIRRQRKRRRKVIHDIGEGDTILDEVASLAPDAERSLIAREHVQIIRDLIGELPPKCRHAFVAYKFDEREYREIAEEMSISESMVRKYVIRAISHCAKRFEELEGWE